jgi:PTH1 family peptidyl-tRNA hydrolase
MKLVVGLGNPGTQYARNRHNVGFMVVDRLASDFRFPEWKDKFSGRFTKGTIDGEDVVLLLPLTYMNESGKSIQAACAFFHVDAKKELVVLHDELEQRFADVRVKIGGGHGGHNGLRSTMGVLGPDFARVRIGIGRPPAGFRGEVADYVLSNFDPVEQASLPDVLGASIEATRAWLHEGPAAATGAGGSGKAKGKGGRAQKSA